MQDGRDHPIDRIVDAEFTEQAGRCPVPRPSMTPPSSVASISTSGGSCPRPDALEAFLKDSSGDKRAAGKPVACSMTSPVYAEHWLTFWNDLLRNDYKGPATSTAAASRSPAGSINR